MSMRGVSEGLYILRMSVTCKGVCYVHVDVVCVCVCVFWAVLDLGGGG